MTDVERGAAVAPVLAQARSDLRDAGCDTPALDVEVLLSHVAGQSRAWLYAHPEHRLTSAQLQAYDSLVRRRAAQEPAAYLVGHREFFGLDFLVTRDVLVPRPETELLVELALHMVPERRAPLMIADVGTGSGILAVTLAAHLPQARVLATDISASALPIARCNAMRHNVADRIVHIQADLLQPVSVTCDLIVSNPPYLRWDELPTISKTAPAWEPRVALDGGPGGLTIIRRLLAMAAQRLHPRGKLLMELGAGQGQVILGLAREHFPHAAAEIFKDYAGLDRVLVVDF
jgi:release factor glutamine methyltransferase